MKNWTEKHILGLVKENKIRGYEIHQKQKNYSANKPNNIPSPKSKGLIWLEWNLLYWANEHSLTLEKEYRFCQERGWRFDFAFPSVKMAVEFEGGIFMNRSGHNSHTGIQRDIDKYTRAQLLGWQVIRVTAKNYTTVLKTLNELIK